MKHLINVLPLAAIVLLGACSSDDTALEPSQASQQTAIGFENYVGRSATRASVTDASNLTNFGVFAYYTKGKQYGTTAETNETNYSANFMDNVQVSGSSVGSDQNWTYSPLRYWPQETDEYVSFLAYAPFASGTTLVSSTGESTGDLTYIKQAFNNTDVVYNSNNALNQQKSMATTAGTTGSNFSSTGKQQMKFSHATSRIAVAITSSTLNDGTIATPTNDTQTTTGDATITINSVKVSGLTSSAYLNLNPTATSRWAADGTATTDKDYTFSSLASTTIQKTGKYTPLAEGGGSVAYEVSTVKSGNSDYLFAIPQNGGLTFTVTYTISYGSTSVTTSHTATGTVSQNFETGKAYLITMDLKGSLSPIQFTVTEVEGWGDETTVPVELN